MNRLVPVPFLLALVACGTSNDGNVGTTATPPAGGSGGQAGSAAGSAGGATSGAAGSGLAGTGSAGNAGGSGVGATGGTGTAGGGSSGTSGKGGAGAAGGAGAGAAGAGGKGGKPVPTSCQQGDILGCGPNNESCCEVLWVPGGTFKRGRSLDGTDKCPAGDSCLDNELPENEATVSGFWMDKHLAVLERFLRHAKYIDQGGVDQGPPGYGLAKAIPKGVGAHPLYPETGLYDPIETWQILLSTPYLVPGTEMYEKLRLSTSMGAPAIALCWLEGGRLATELEIEFASAGGDENRLYPWGSAPPGAGLTATATDLVFEVTWPPSKWANVYKSVFRTKPGQMPANAGRWGHVDLAGHVGQQTLDGPDPFDLGYPPGTCIDCVNSNAPGGRGALGWRSARRSVSGGGSGARCVYDVPKE